MHLFSFNVLTSVFKCSVKKIKIIIIKVNYLKKLCDKSDLFSRVAMDEKLGERIGEHLSAIILGRKKEKAAGNRRAPIKTTS